MIRPVMQSGPRTMILFEPSKSRRFSVRIELRAHDSPASVSTWLAALPTIASLRETGYRRDGVQNSVDRSLAECVEAEVGVALSVTEKIDRWSKSGEGDRMDSGQLLMTTTTTPTKAIRAHSNSLSPQRLNRSCTGELLPNSSYKQGRYLSKDCGISVCLVLWQSRIARFRTVRTVRKSGEVQAARDL